jgi:predicted AAA+ superfamily ATPase
MRLPLTCWTDRTPLFCSDTVPSGYNANSLKATGVKAHFVNRATAKGRFWTMLAHYHAQTWNASELSCAMGVSDKTVRSYLDILTGAFMVWQLQPWYENISKRQVRAPKVYLRWS